MKTIEVTIPFFNQFFIYPDGSIKFTFPVDKNKETEISKALLNALGSFSGAFWEDGGLCFAQQARLDGCVDQFLDRYLVDTDSFKEFKKEIATATKIIPRFNAFVGKLAAQNLTFTAQMEEKTRPSVVSTAPFVPLVSTISTSRLSISLSDRNYPNISSSLNSGQAAIVPVLPPISSETLSQTKGNLKKAETAPLPPPAPKVLTKTVASGELKKETKELEFPMLSVYIRAKKESSHSNANELVFVFANNQEENFKSIQNETYASMKQEVMVDAADIEVRDPLTCQKNEVIFDLNYPYATALVRKFLTIYFPTEFVGKPRFIKQIRDYVSSAVPRTSGARGEASYSLLSSLMGTGSVYSKSKLARSSLSSKIFPLSADFKESAVRLTFSSPEAAVMIYYLLVDKSIKNYYTSRPMENRIVLEDKQIYIPPAACKLGDFSAFLNIYTSSNPEVKAAAAQLATRSKSGEDWVTLWSKNRAEKCAEQFKVLQKNQHDITAHLDPASGPNPSPLGEQESRTSVTAATVEITAPTKRS
jgi:hypothetical protein